MSSQGAPGKHSFQGDSSDWIAYKKRSIVVAKLSNANGADKTRFDVVQSNQLRIDYNLGELTCVYPTIQRYPHLRIGRDCTNNF